MKTILSLKTFTITISAVALLLVVGVYAQVNTKLTISIQAASLAVAILDASNSPVTSPSVSFGAYTRSGTCGDTTGTLGEAAQKIRVTNPGASDSGWILTIAGSATTAEWTSASEAAKKFDYNDPGNSNDQCTDLTGGSSDADATGGQLTVDPSGATLTAVGAGATTGITKGTAGSFHETDIQSITLLTAANTSDDFGSWDLIGVALSQKIPANQVIASDYELSLVLTVTAQ